VLPDLALIPPGDYRRAHPTHALLIVEVAESSLRKDSSIKADLHARSHVDESWIVDLNARSVLVHSVFDGTTYRRRFAAPPGGLAQPRLVERCRTRHLRLPRRDL